MLDIRVIIANIRKLAAIMFWTMAGFFVLFIDHATIGAASRAIATYLELVGVQGIDKLLSLMVMPSGLVMQAISAVRLGAVIVKIASIMLVAVPIYALYVLATNISYLPVSCSVTATLTAELEQSSQNSYLINNTIRC